MLDASSSTSFPTEVKVMIKRDFSVYIHPRDIIKNFSTKRKCHDAKLLQNLIMYNYVIMYIYVGMCTFSAFCFRRYAKQLDLLMGLHTEDNNSIAVRVNLLEKYLLLS